MFTPEISVDIAKSDWVTCRAQPPSWMRFDARLNEVQNCGMPPTSVAGGLRNDGMLLASAGSCGPRSTSASGLVTLMAPCGGSSGFPNVAACARVAAAAVAAPPAAAVVRTLRREMSFMISSARCVGLESHRGASSPTSLDLGWPYHCPVRPAGAQTLDHQNVGNLNGEEFLVFL